MAAGTPILRWSRFDSFADVLDQVRLLGAAVGEEAGAAALGARVTALLDDLSARLRGVRPKRVLYYDPPVYTMGRGTLVGEMLARAGGANVVDEIGIVGPGQIGLETVLALEPEAIVVPRYADNSSALRTLGASAIWREVPAVRAGRVLEVPGAWIATVSHHAARGLARVARLLHPEAFAGTTNGRGDDPPPGDGGYWGGFVRPSPSPSPSLPPASPWSRSSSVTGEPMR